MTPTQNLRAAALVVGGIVTFCINDVIVKQLTSVMPTGEIMTLRGVFVVTILLIVLPRLGLPYGRPDRFSILRAVAEVGVNASFILGLFFLPLGDIYTLYFAAPILLTAAAAIVLKERVGPRRWAAVLVGFLGVVIVVGGPGTWQPVILLPLVAAALSVVRDLATRKVRPDVGSGTVSLVTAIAVTLGGMLTLPFGWIVPDLTDVLLCVAAAFGAAAGYTLFVMGLRTGDLSFVSAFRYSGLPVAMLFGFVLWGDVPAARMVLGAIIIVGSGLFILHRERQLARRARAAAGDHLAPTQHGSRPR